MENSQENLCRLCLKISDDAHDLFHFKHGHQIADLVKVICPIEIEINENRLPRKVCKDCLELIIDAIHLRDISLMNDQELRQGLQDEDVELKPFKLESEDQEEEEVYIEALDEATLDNLNVKYRLIEEPQTSADPKRNFCELCNKTFVNPSSFKRHQLRKHADIRYNCDICPIVLKTKNDIDKHMRRKHLVKYPEVKFLYSERLSVDVTDMYEKLDEPQGLICTFCSYVDFDEDLLNEHLATHQDVVDSGKMYCIHCPQPIPTMEFMIEHTKSHNEKIKTHRCKICKKTFPYDDRFLIHLRNHKKNQHKICFCPTCGRKFSKPRLLDDHIRFIHNKESLYCCPKCGQGFGSKSALNGHMKRHLEGKKFLCPFCPKTFSSHNLLISHKVIHSTDRVSGKLHALTSNSNFCFLPAIRVRIL